MIFKYWDRSVYYFYIVDIYCWYMTTIGLECFRNMPDRDYMIYGNTCKPKFFEL